MCELWRVQAWFNFCAIITKEIRAYIAWQPIKPRMPEQIWLSTYPTWSSQGKFSGMSFPAMSLHLREDEHTEFCPHSHQKVCETCVFCCFIRTNSTNTRKCKRNTITYYKYINIHEYQPGTSRNCLNLKLLTKWNLLGHHAMTSNRKTSGEKMWDNNEPTWSRVWKGYEW